MNHQIRFTEDMRKLESMFANMIRRIKEAVAISSSIVDEWSSEGMEEVAQLDRKAGELESLIREECIKILALYQPVASDLRYVLAVLAAVHTMKTVSERAVKIAGWAEQLMYQQAKKEDIPFRFREMSESVRDLLDKALGAILERDIDGLNISAEKERIEAIHHQNRLTKVDSITNNASMAPIIDKAWCISNHYKNMSDAIEDIACEAYFLVTGERARTAP